MGKAVLLTGARGFLGRRIVETVSARGYVVSTPGRPEFDLMNKDSVEKVLRAVRPEIIIHSAAHYGGLGICVAEPMNLFLKNVGMTINLFDAMVSVGGVERFLSIGSACAYPGDVAGDMREDDYWHGPLHPSVEAYGFTKKVQQVAINAYAKQRPLRGQVAILTNLYGEHDAYNEYRSHVVGAFIKRFSDAARDGLREVTCWGSGNPVREFLYVGDAAEAVARLLETDYFEPLNIGTGIGTTIRELAETVAEYTGFKGRITWDAGKPDGVMRKVLDVRRMKEVLGWEPPTSLREGLRRTSEWYRDHKDEADARP